MSRFVIPSTTTLTLANGDTLTVRTRLNAGQAHARHAMLYKWLPDQSRVVDVLMLRRATMVSYLLDWKLAGEDVPIRGLGPDELLEVINNLEQADFEEIRDAIEAHDMAQEAQLAAQKKTPSTASALSPISTSLDAVTGVMSGSPS